MTKWNLEMSNVFCPCTSYRNLPKHTLFILSKQLQEQEKDERLPNQMCHNEYVRSIVAAVLATEYPCGWQREKPEQCWIYDESITIKRPKPFIVRTRKRWRIFGIMYFPGITKVHWKNPNAECVRAYTWNNGIFYVENYTLVLKSSEATNKR